ncbi:transglutaminase N-terminal domain-containing protein, partial [uncultured Lamprocystis sp.]|uniref:transglutaminase N-terminal domain-containing protein n=1 Tax=uncultured Lamprocystis sp. TaxID=543132 RepID=UPI0025FD4EEA
QLTYSYTKPVQLGPHRLCLMPRPLGFQRLISHQLQFTPEEGEDRLYHLVSDYLQRDNLQALPASVP